MELGKLVRNEVARYPSINARQVSRVVSSGDVFRQLTIRFTDLSSEFTIPDYDIALPTQLSVIERARAYPGRSVADTVAEPSIMDAAQFYEDHVTAKGPDLVPHMVTEALQPTINPIITTVSVCAWLKSGLY